MGNVLRIVIGLAGLTAAGWSALRTLRLRRHGQEAEAVVVESRMRGSMGPQGDNTTRWVSTVRFEDGDGVEHVSEVAGKHEEGDTVLVRYVPGRTGKVARPGQVSFGEAFAILLATAAMIAFTLLI
ncbi:DUF3592 domain-containing protein [Jiangella muralis]|uniref:DUF3592 domain-containing protein n=1 Tax=Jiangella muralis TaxID=702383 RepID=UPI00069D5780|nr:DUF3592 domain-containing protein [Jiangella muralis]